MPLPTARQIHATTRYRPYSSALRAGAALGLMGLLAACAGTPPPAPTQPAVSITQEAASYRQHAKSYYAPPGPPSDPWGPYIREASTRFDVPEQWIRSVMMRESRGQLYDSNGNFTVSVPGAMGLLQLMPPTYDDMRVQYALGDDPFDPHDNILAGTAYLRQLYDIYGSPGFLAAYNDGPGNLDRYLRQGRPLPRETRRYVAAIGHQIVGIWPHNRSDADLMVAQHDPNARIQIAQNTPGMTPAVAPPEDTAESSAIRAAWRRKNAEETSARTSGPTTGTSPDNDAPVEVAEATETTPLAGTSSPGSVSAAWAARGIQATPVQTTYRPPMQSAHTDDAADNQQIAAQQIPIGHRLPAQPIMALVPSHRPRYRLAPALREGVAARTTGASHGAPHDWAIQVGAFANAVQAGSAASRAHSTAGALLASAHTQVAGVKSGRAHLYRARLTGLSHANALAACHRLSHASPCVVVPPGTH